jgi:hypothetical protein
MFEKYIGRIIVDMEYDNDGNLTILLDNGEILQVNGEPSYDDNNGVYVKESE